LLNMMISISTGFHVSNVISLFSMAVWNLTVCVCECVCVCIMFPLWIHSSIGN
jgi:hypothetical protein